tara:strand:- start:1228 stop:1404 length:177 start_codon:yes stop_codon:yes gene_type:complete
MVCGIVRLLHNSRITAAAAAAQQRLFFLALRVSPVSCARCNVHGKATINLLLLWKTNN